MSLHRVLAALLLLVCIHLLMGGGGAAQLRAQSLTFHDVDVSAFPLVRAKFFAFNQEGKQLFGWLPQDVRVRENGLERAVSGLTCPLNSQSVPISSVFIIDAALPIAFAQAAADAWVTALPPPPSECAITTFRTHALISLDLSTDRTALRNAIAEIGTMYGLLVINSALLTPPAGALPILEKATHRKVMILLSNFFGWNITPSQASIVNEARRQGAILYCVVVGSPAPDFVRELCTQTGGAYFDRVNTEQEAIHALLRISSAARQGAPCQLEWESDGCDASRSVEISIPGIDATDAGSFELPPMYQPQLLFSPNTSLRFGETSPGIPAEKQIVMSAQGRRIRVEDVIVSDNRFRVVDYGGSGLPFELAIGESRTLTIAYTASDYAYAFCHFEVKNDGCRPSSFTADAGWRGASDGGTKGIRVVRANGGEVFSAGEEELLCWEGVMPEERVRLEYSTDAGVSWMPISDTATGLSHVWRVEKHPGDRCLLRATGAEHPVFEMEMARIPAGSFRMGNITGHHIGDLGELPVHTVTLSRPFLMGRTEVTERQYLSVVGALPCAPRGEFCPVVCITWYDAIAFCNRLSRLQGLDTCYSGEGDDIICDMSANGYRLPTEAEWEYACRAGTETDFFNGDMRFEECSPVDPVLDAVGWYCGNAFDVRPVGLKQPNSFGLYDMHGNAWEWCWDWMDTGYYRVSPAVDPAGPTQPGDSRYPRRVVRGGSWARYAWDACSGIRYAVNPGPRQGIFGFRVVRSQ